MATRFCWFVLTFAVCLFVIGTGQADEAGDKQSPEMPWSEPVAGIVARIEGHRRNDVYVCLRNVSHSKTTVPGNLWANHPNEVYVLEGFIGGAWTTLPWQEPRHQAGKRARYPKVRLKPGESVLIRLRGKGGHETERASRFRVRIELGGQTLITPAVAAYPSEAETTRVKGTQPLPRHLPPFDTFDISDALGNGPPGGPASRLLGLFSQQSSLIRQLDLYRDDEVVKALRDRLNDGDIHDRLLVATLTARRGDNRGRELILRCARSPDAPKLASAITALDSLTEDANASDWAIDELIRILKDTRPVRNPRWLSDTPVTVADVAEEQHIAWRLAAREVRAVTPLLIQGVREGRDDDIVSLGSTGDPAAIPPLLETLRRIGPAAKWDYRYGVDQNFEDTVEALANLEATQAVPDLLKYIEFPVTIKALRRLGDRRAVEPLKAIASADGRVSGDESLNDPKLIEARLLECRLALAILEEGDRLPRLAAILRDQSLDEFARREIVWHLGNHPDPRAAPLLIEAIKSDKSGAVVNQAITVLRVYRFEGVVESLIGCFEADFAGKRDWKRAYEPEMFQSNIAATLRILTGESIGNDPEAWRAWHAAHGRAHKRDEAH